MPNGITDNYLIDMGSADHMADALAARELADRSRSIAAHLEHAKYLAFLERKTQCGADSGFKPLFMPDSLFPFQSHLADYAIRGGRRALFADCGLGKTALELTFAENVMRHTNKPVLLLDPLAVSPQTVREGEKFGVSAKQSRDGTVYRDAVTVTNYEQLHRFDWKDFGGVVCDECFPPDTLIDSPLGACYIKDVRVGQIITNASGEDRVSDVHRREVKGAIRITVERRLWKGPKPVDSITSSPNHPYFTQRGWVCAQDLQPSDSIMATSEAMRLVREGRNPSHIAGGSQEFLRQVLFSEMADGEAGIQGEDLHTGATKESYPGNQGLVGTRHSRGSEGETSNKRIEPDVQPGNQSEGLPHIESHELQTFRTWRKWDGTDRGTVIYGEGVRAEVGNGVCLITGPKDSGLSDLLQDGLSRSRAENCNRGGWSLSSLPEGSGPKEGCQVGFSRVESLEVLEPGHPDLERYRDADGRIYFYDIGATRHPSFSINGLLVHNSSILKSFDGATRTAVTEFMRKIPYRLLATATPAPNDYIELGTSSEALGFLGHMDMLARFFKNDRNTCDTRTTTRRAPAMGGPVSSGWRFKGHAEIPFLQFVTSWARACRRPSDLGFSDEGFALPELIEQDHMVESSTLAPGKLFPTVATNMREEREERRRTLKERCEKAAELAQDGKPFVIWCQLNDEGDLLADLLKDCAIQISGNHCDEEKEERYLAFSRGHSRGLITKQKIGGWGLNWQHCAHVIEFATHSYEAHYQGVRRCWRFGQKNPVTNDVIYTEGQRAIKDNMRRKAEQADHMFTSLVAEMNHAAQQDKDYSFTQKAELPSWL